MHQSETVWEFSMAERVKFGVGAAEELPSAITERNAESVLLLTDPGIEDAGIVTYLTGLLDAADVEYHVYTDVEPEPSLGVYESAIQLAEDRSPDLVIGVGGGSSMDVAKTTSAVTAADGSILEYATPPTGDGKPLPDTGIPCFCLPTTAGTGSETSPVAVISVPEEALKGGISSRHLLPQLAIVDPNLAISLPPEPTAFSGMDALGHAVEAYTAIPFDAKPRPSTPRDRPEYNGRSILTDQFARKAIDLIGRNLRRAVDNGYDVEARRNMALASLMAGMAFTNAGTTAAHALAMATGAEYDVPHGIAVAMFLPEVVRFNAPSVPDRCDDIVRLLGEDPDETSAGDAIANLRADVRLPRGLNAFDITRDQVPQIAEKASRLDRLLSKNVRRMTKTDLEGVLERSL
ncbi:hydroxyacid-oxoacid transhydrogenase [Halomarina halobia]|uniref:hydroxyacid-oxoacid transhydrogenase n=1 Tax=Halomarina halobia TaxID=3033386 RepID=A0ABD6AE68_9EURY|nr:hydroxyacid-oxoacid transhydrogenase [Halomarina sp. PSR21]